MNARAWTSAFYTGRVFHVRLGSLAHRFNYGHFLVGLELGELPALFKGRWLWSAEHFNLAAFRRGDHLGDPARPLADCVRELVRQRTGSAPEGRIVLLTQLRHFGYVFNPVSFYFCLDASGATQAIVAEINNTPWGEQHCYVLCARDAEHGPDGRMKFRFAKDFHISPFFPMQLEYEWIFSSFGPQISISMKNFERGALIFSSELRMESRAWSATSAALALALHPLMSFKTIAAIYWQALRLRLKGATFFPHPLCPETNVKPDEAAT